MSYPRYESYKDSGVAWLGEVPAGWGVKPLKRLVNYNSESLPETTAPELLLKYIDISSVNLVAGITKIEEVEFEKAPSRARRIVRDGDTIISTVRTYLKAITAIQNPEDNTIVSTGFAVIRPQKNIHPSYLGYFLQSDGFIGEVVSKSVGVSYPAINPTDLVSIKSLLPPLTEQKAIAYFLDKKTEEIDALIEKREGLLELLAEQRAALITHAVTRGLDDSAPLKDSGIAWLGQVPKSWEVRKFANFYSARMGQTILGSDVEESGKIPVLSATEQENIFGYIEKADVILQPNDLVIPARGNSIGHVKLVKFPCTSTQTTILCRQIKHMNPTFVKYYLLGLRKILFYFDRTAIPQLTVNQVKTNPLLVPPIAEQKAIADFLDDKTARIDNIKDKIITANETLKEYRTALITSAVTGKIKVV